VTTITCPQGFGETDRARCIDRAAVALDGTGCLLCPIPPVLIALGGEDELNQRLANRLQGLLSSAWTPPARKTPPSTFHKLSRGKGLSKAVAHYLASYPGATSIPLTKLLRIHNATQSAMDISSVDSLATAIRRQGLPLMWRGGRPFLTISEHTRAFLRSHKEAA
jgi:hypothetical protein